MERQGREGKEKKKYFQESEQNIEVHLCQANIMN